MDGLIDFQSLATLRVKLYQSDAASCALVAIMWRFYCRGEIQSYSNIRVHFFRFFPHSPWPASERANFARSTFYKPLRSTHFGL